LNTLRLAQPTGPIELEGLSADAEPGRACLSPPSVNAGLTVPLQ